MINKNKLNELGITDYFIRLYTATHPACHLLAVIVYPLLNFRQSITKRA